MEGWRDGEQEGGRVLMETPDGAPATTQVSIKWVWKCRWADESAEAEGKHRPARLREQDGFLSRLWISVIVIVLDHWCARFSSQHCCWLMVSDWLSYSVPGVSETALYCYCYYLEKIFFHFAHQPTHAQNINEACLNVNEVPLWADIFACTAFLYRAEKGKNKCNKG